MAEISFNSSAVAMADYEQQQDESQYDQPQEQGDQGYAAEEQAPAETENNIDNYNNNNSSNRGNNNRGGDRGGSGRGGNFRGAPRGRGRGDFQQRGRGGFQSRGGGGFAGQKRGFQDQYSGNVSGMEFVKKRKVNDNVHRILVPVKSVKTIIGPKGESIKALKEDAGEGCKISIYTQSTNKVPLPEGTSERVISIEGDMDQLKKCLVDIIPKVQGVPIERVRGKLTLKLMIPEHCCSMVIGPKGANSKAIREETGSTVQVFTDPLPGSGEHVVQLRNQELDQIVAAAVKVFEIIREGKSQNNVLLFEPHIWTPGEFGTTGSYHDDSYGAYGNQGGNQGGYGGNQGGNQGGYGGNQGGNQGGYGGNQGGNQQYYNNQGNNQQSYDDQSYYNEDQSYYNEQGAGYYEEETQGGYDQGYDQGTQGGYQEEAPYVEPAYQAPAPRGRGGRARGPLLGSSPGNRGAARGGSAPPSRGNFAGSRGGRGANGSPRGAPRGGAPRGAPRGRGNGGGDSRGFSRGGRGGPRGAPRGGSRGRGGQY